MWMVDWLVELELVQRRADQGQGWMMEWAGPFDLDDLPLEFS